MKVRRFKFVFEQLVRLDRTFFGKLAAVCAASGAAARSLYGQFEEAFGKNAFLSDHMVLFLIAAFALAAIFGALHVLNVAPKIFRPRSEPGRFNARLVRSEQEALALQSEIVRLFFPRSPLPTRARQAQQKNSERLIGVFEGDDVVGYCALWPVRREIGLALLAGQMTDDDLMPEHLISTEENKTAEFIVIVGIGVLPEVATMDPRAGAKLIRATKETLRDRYFAGDDRTITLIAIAYTSYGKKACEVLDLKETGMYVAYDADELRFGTMGKLFKFVGLLSTRRHPVCSRNVSLSDVAWASEFIE